MGFIEQYLLQLNTEKRRWRLAVIILTALSLIVALVTVWNLRMTGVTIANGAACGQEEHQHSSDCAAQTVLICGYDPQQDAPAEDAEETAEAAEPETVHTHTESCYAVTYSCGQEEHIHKIACYSDPLADVETAVDWEQSLPKELVGVWADDLFFVAKSQIGTAESERNYILAEDGETKQGITRYGQWYGNPYGDWSSMFVMFCLHYANIPEDAIPQSPGVYNMMRLAQDAQIFLQPDENMACGGNLVFLDTDENGNADRLVIVSACENETITAICGDWDHAVAEITFSGSDPRIMGYIHTGQLQALWEAQEEPAPSEPADPDSAEPEQMPEEDPAETPPEETPPEETPPEETPPEETPPEETPPEETPPEETPSEEPEEAPETPVISLEVDFPEEGILRLTAEISNVDAAMYAWQWQVSEDGNEPWIDIEGATGLVCELEDTEENFNRYYRLQGRKTVMMRFMARAAEPDDASQDGSTIVSEAITPFSIGKNNKTYTIDVYAIPVDENGNRITELGLTELNSFSVTYNGSSVTVKNRFDTDLGTYHSAYFGTAATVSVDNIDSVWCDRYYSRGYQYTLAYRQTNGTENDRWLTSANNSASLYLRYIPEFTVTFASEGFTSLTETVAYGGFPKREEPGAWSREGYTLLGWTVNGNEQNVYTFAELRKLPVTENVTYTAKWVREVTVSFHLGEYAYALNPIDPMVIPYGSTISPLPTPIWNNNAVAMSFDGWYLNEELTQQVTSEYEFFGNTILYAKWSSKDDGYYVYFMDFARDGQVPLVLVTYSVTEGQTVSPYTPGNAPAGMEWNETWYLDSSCTRPFNFSIPVSDMKDDLTGASGRDLYLYPGVQAVCRAIFVTYGTKVDPVTVPVGGSINLDRYKPQRAGFEFAGWTLQDGTPVSGVQTLSETTTFYAKWDAGYVPFEAILRIENANDTGMTQAEILGTWYAKSGSQIRVKSTYSGSGNNRTGTHQVVCVIDGTEYPVYKDSALTQRATLSDVYATYFLYNNTGTSWTDEVNWDDIYTGGEVPYSTRPVSSAGDTIINFDYMRVRNDIVFTIVNSNSGAYIDVFKLYRDGLITGSVTYTGTKPTTTGNNVSATGVSAENIRWSYTAASKVGSSYNNSYTLHDMKYGQRIYEVYPVGGSWLTTRGNAFHWYKAGTGELFSSRREDLSADFFTESGRKLTPTSLTAVFAAQDKIALMYAIECLPGETADFTIDGIGYKVQTQLCEVVNHTGDFTQKELLGCEKKGNSSYSNLSSTTSKLGGTSIKTLFGTTYWDYYRIYDGVSSLSDIDKAYVFYYTRLHMDIQFNLGYDSNGNGANETVKYENIAYGLKIDEYQFGMPNNQVHPLLDREGYAFVGWLDSNGFVLQAEDWDSMVATGDSENSTMIFIAKWEKISNNIVEYYEDRSSSQPFESHYFDDGELVPFPTMSVYPEGWVWQEYGKGPYQRFDWDVPMYGEYGVQEIRQRNGEPQAVNVLRIYGTWDESHTRVVYDPNAPQGGVPGSAPSDTNEYTIWQSEVPVASRGETANADPDMVFVGWRLDRNGIVYQPGDHVPVQWPRTMIFTAQWAKAEEVVHLRYDPNGGTPEEIYPNDTGFPYKKNATAAVWDNTWADGTVWFSRTGYVFTGWNTASDGSGTAYQPNASIVLTAPVTTLYAQWRKTSFTLSVNKVDSDSSAPLTGAAFGLYRQKNGVYVAVETLTTGVDGHITFGDLETDTLYKLVEEKPPNGYAVIAKEIFFALRPNGSTVSLRFYDSAGREIPAPNGVTGEYISGIHVLTLTVKNLRGYELPSTGGSGIYLHILCGLILMAAPLVYGIGLRRKFERRSRK